MEKQLDILKKTRKNLLSVISGLSLAQLNEIPVGFNNNVAWNFGHVIATQQGLCYLRAGLPIVIDQALLEKYKSGTKPEKEIGFDELEILKQLSLSTIDQFETGFQNNLFNHYTPWTNRYGVELANIQDAIAFLIFHEGIHLGYIMALKHVVKI